MTGVAVTRQLAGRRAAPASRRACLAAGRAAGDAARGRRARPGRHAARRCTARLPLNLPLRADAAGALLIQIGTNFANDVFDFRTRRRHRRASRPAARDPGRPGHAAAGADGDVRHVRAGAADRHLPGQRRRLADPARSASSVLLVGLPYTGGPWPFGYHGLGDLVCFIFFGVLAVLGTRVPAAARDYRRWPSGPRCRSAVW